MSVKLKCTCGEMFVIADEQRGTIVNCPSCQRKLKVPLLPSKKKTADESQMSGPETDGDSAAPSGSDDKSPLLDPLDSVEVGDSSGLGPALAGPTAKGTGSPCESCRGPMATDAVICVQCGYNRKLGRRMASASERQALAAADAALAEEEASDRERTGKGMPWQVYAFALAVVVVAVVAVPFMSRTVVLMIGAGFMLCGVAVFFLAMLGAVLGFSLINPMRMFLNLTVPFSGLAGTPSSDEVARGEAVDIGAGKVALIGIILGFFGLFVVCCGARETTPQPGTPAGTSTHAPVSPSR